MSKRSFGTINLTKAELEAKSMAELITLHNKLVEPEKRVKAIHTKVKAVEKVWAIGGEPVAEATVASAEGGRAKRSITPPSGGAPGRPKSDDNFPAQPADKRKEPRPGTKVFRLLCLVGSPGGATMEELMKETKTSRGAARGIIRWLASENMGWGFRTEKDGRRVLIDENNRAIHYKPKEKSAKEAAAAITSESRASA